MMLTAERRIRQFFWGLLNLTLLSLLVPLVGCSPLLEMEVKEQRMVGNELRLVVETSREEFGLTDLMTPTAPNIVDLKGYCIVIDLASSKPLAERTKIYGPLWDVKRSGAAPSFKRDRGEYESEWYAFDTDGTLLRFTRDGVRGVWVREALVTTPAEALWKREGDVEITPVPSGDNVVAVGSGRFILVYAEGRAQCFDRFTGQRREDDWLTDRFAEARSIPRLDEVMTTEDLNHLVIIPKNRSGTFDLAGATYNRADFGIAYSRPSKAPLVFAHQREKCGRETPDAAVSIDGELFLFASRPSIPRVRETTLQLYKPDRSREIVSKAPKGEKWHYREWFSEVQQDAAADELIILGTRGFGGDTLIRDGFRWVRWNYATNTVTPGEDLIGDLFEARKGVLRPKAGVAVKRSGDPSWKR